MGTRGDFYVGRGKSAEWLGSVALDAYPHGIDAAIRLAESEGDYRSAVAFFLRKTESATRPEQGWPWPWDDSRTTDYAYAFDAGHVYGSCFGHAWFPADGPEPEEPEEEGTEETFPDMSSIKNVALGKRSGLLIIG